MCAMLIDLDESPVGGGGAVGALCWEFVTGGVLSGNGISAVFPNCLQKFGGISVSGARSGFSVFVLLVSNTIVQGNPLEVLPD